MIEAPRYEAQHGELLERLGRAEFGATVSVRVADRCHEALSDQVSSPLDILAVLGREIGDDNLPSVRDERALH
jgi:hypothetical protein